MFSKELEFDKWNIYGFKKKKSYLFQNIDSTHTHMKRMAQIGEIEPGTLFIANTQTSSHGRHERTWLCTPDKNLYFNILIPLENIATNCYSQITQVAAISFAKIFQNLNENDTSNIFVKWPNDIFYKKSKFCGILSEVIFLPKRKPALNMGVGINVNSSPQEYSHLNKDITTLKTITNKIINREKLLQVLINELEIAIEKFKQKGILPWINSWRKMNHFLGNRGTIILNNRCTDNSQNKFIQKESGIIMDINPDGSLLFKTDNGDIRTIYSADLEI